MESSQRDLFLDMVFDRFIFENSQITLSSCFTVITETGAGLPTTGVSFHCVKGNENGRIESYASLHYFSARLVGDWSDYFDLL